MDKLLEKLLKTAGISGYEAEIAKIMSEELAKSCAEVEEDSFGNVIGCKGSGKKKIMLAAHMDEVGFVVKYVSKEGFIRFVKVGSIDDRILPGQRVVIKSAKGDICGIIGAKPPHIQKEEERKQPVKPEDMFIDIGAKSREEVMERVSIADMIIFEPNAGLMPNNLVFGKAVDDRVGCYALLKIMERVNVAAEIYAVATAQEEVGLKGARTASFRLNPDFALALDTTIAGDIPGVREEQSALKLGEGVSICTLEAGGRGFIVSSRIRKILTETAEKNNIKYQIDVLEGGMTDAAMIYMNREGVSTGVLSVPTRYIHSPAAVFSLDDLQATIDLAVKAVEELAKL
ncbi:MAG: M42 family metallopeptidase [Candidatus Omnitrophica bacterium]|nr:M42 family metallopeptidase [Candidatus Omnitrophota bacterium]MBU4479225.1 M42 family metallopeptidase [Candidatus Omnitrophota bacterium]MCG2703915.1 M42 family metallopeptidase [Candidatus Omnitrophota bacterium]